MFISLRTVEQNKFVLTIFSLYKYSSYIFLLTILSLYCIENFYMECFRGQYPLFVFFNVLTGCNFQTFVIIRIPSLIKVNRVYRAYANDTGK